MDTKQNMPLSHTFSAAYEGAITLQECCMIRHWNMTARIRIIISGLFRVL
jgi:hypothetical protein